MFCYSVYGQLPSIYWVTSFFHLSQTFSLLAESVGYKNCIMFTLRLFVAAILCHK